MNDAGTADFVETCLPGDYPSAGAIVDGEGDLWVSQYTPSPNGTWITLWSPEQLEQSCSAPPMQLAALAGGDDFPPMAFDSNGYLWLLGDVVEHGELDGYDVARLRQGLDVSGQPDGITEVNGCDTLSSVCAPVDLAFDAAGYLWVSGAYSVVAFSPETLSRDGGAVVSGDLFLTTALAEQFYDELLDAGVSNITVDDSYGNLVFDAAGNLWVTVSNPEHPLDYLKLVEFSKAQLEDLAQDPIPTPIVAIPNPPGARRGLRGPLAFDAEGNLWMPGWPSDGTDSEDAGVLFRFSPENLATGVPDRLIVPFTGYFGSSLTFSPIPPGLPLQP